MTIDVAALRQLHEAHQIVATLRARLHRGGLQVRASENKVRKHEEELAEMQELGKRTKLRLADKELQLKERENRILDWKGKLNSCSTNKEYQTIIERIAADEQANSVLADEILELMDKVSQQGDEVARLQGILQQAQADLEQLRSRVAAEMSQLEHDIPLAEQRLREAERFLPQEIRPAYERVVKAHGSEALAPVEDDNCSGCYQRITPQMLNELRMHQLVCCKNCGRLLYVL